ncbi:MAG: iron ABC transporter substrate-binding protein [Spirochaetota bacterium]
MEQRVYARGALIMLLLLVTAAAIAQGNFEAPGGDNEQMITITDSLGRVVDVPRDVQRVICSGAGALRLLVYLQASEMAVAVDDIESSASEYEARPYAIAHPELSRLPVFGQFRGNDNPELILGLDPAPQVIFKTFPEAGYDPDELQKKTGIPVVALSYGNLTYGRDDLYASLRRMGTVIGRSERSEEVVDFIEETIEDLAHRSEQADSNPLCYVGGVAYQGPQGITATEPAYPPFLLLGVRHAPFDPQIPLREQQHAQISKEQLLAWDPDYLFLDTATLQLGTTESALYQLSHDPVFTHLQAVQRGSVYGLLPYNWYSLNYGSALANAYYVGKVLYPKQFSDIDPVKRADELYTFLVGEAVFERLNSSLDQLGFSTILLDREELP